MNIAIYNISLVIFIIGFLLGIKLMNSPITALKGNLLGGLSMLCAVAATMLYYDIMNNNVLWLSMGTGSVIGLVLGLKAAMIRMPQIVALLNGLGGGASALTAFAVLGYTHDGSYITGLTGNLALSVGVITFGGSMIAAAKLDQKIDQKPIRINYHTAIGYCLIAIMIAILAAMVLAPGYYTFPLSILTVVAGLMVGVLFAIRIGGADMPITIALLNSLSGLAGSITGFAVRNTLLVAVGAIVGAAGLILTRIMCNAMNRSMLEVITGRTVSMTQKPCYEGKINNKDKTESTDIEKKDDIELLRAAKRVIIVPGYGMALSQAQHTVKDFYSLLSDMGKDVQFAIHPVAGRMPGHMNVLLAEADIPYDLLLEIDDANQLFNDVDAVLIVGANDVINPAANTADGTPIYGMPILMVSEAKHIIVCNLDRKPGYAGVDNPLYEMNNVSLRLGDAKQIISDLVADLKAKNT